jgi:hypothetical protein
MNFHIRKILSHHTAGGDNGASTNNNSRTKHGFGADPRTPSASNWPAKQPHVEGRPVMIAGAEIYALGQAAVCLYCYLR